MALMEWIAGVANLTAGLGLKTAVMDVESYATQTAFELIERTLPQQGKDQNIAVFDIGSNLMTLSVLRNGQSVYAREQPFGGNQLTQDIQRVFGLTPEEAEAAKRTAGQLPGARVSRNSEPLSCGCLLKASNRPSGDN